MVKLYAVAPGTRRGDRLRGTRGLMIELASFLRSWWVVRPQQLQVVGVVILKLRVAKPVLTRRIEVAGSIA